jgi:CMP-N,N'-diacetyllegionaminic acid synthase
MSIFENIIFVIPARGGSKGVPQKNIKPFLGKPLIHYSIEYTRLFTSDENICLTTDDENIIACGREIGLDVPFIRPSDLANDTATTFDVIQHAYNYYISLGKKIDAIILLQPTSPLRERKHIEEAIKLYNQDIEMVVSVCEAKNNPYFTLFEEDKEGYLKISKGDGSFTRRQDTPVTYEYNGSIYIINPIVLETMASFKEITKKVKYVMDDYFAVDIDTVDDWNYAEYKYSKDK